MAKVDSDDTPDLSDWPEVPAALRPKNIYHAHNLQPKEFTALVANGWTPVDVRLLAATNDVERGSAVKDWLEGVRLGSIMAIEKVAKYVELEARIYGLTVTKGPGTEKPKVDGSTIEALLSVTCANTNAPTLPSSNE